MPNGKVFYSGSTTISRLFDPSAKTWTNVATTNYGSSRSYGTSVLLPLTPTNNYDARVLIMGGGNPSTPTTEIIDLGASTPAWQWGPNMSQSRTEMSATILPDGKVLATGGSLNDEDTTTASLNADLFDPATSSFLPTGAGAISFQISGAHVTRAFEQQRALDPQVRAGLRQIEQSGAVTPRPC